MVKFALNKTITQLLTQWQGGPQEDATREDLHTL